MNLLESKKYYANKSYCYVEWEGGLHIVKSKILSIKDNRATMENGKVIHVDNLFHPDRAPHHQSILDGKS